MIWSILDVFPKVRSGQKSLADDSVDKLNRSITVIIMFTSAIFILSKSFGQTIICLVDPQQMTPMRVEYAESLCWLKEIKVLEFFFASGLEKNNQRQTVNTNAYAWIPFIILLFALLFYFPYLMWKVMLRKSYYHHVPVDIDSVISLLKKSPSYRRDEFEKNVIMVSDYLHQCFTKNNVLNPYDERKRWRSFKNRSKMGKEGEAATLPRVKIYFPLIAKYIFIKLLYLAVNLLIFVLADALLQFRRPFYQYGPSMLRKYTSSNESEIESITSKYFYTNIFCNIDARGDYKNTYKQQYHCSLPANVFNEKVFLVIWCWLAMLLLFNVYTIVTWLIRIVFRRQVIFNMLAWPNNSFQITGKELDQFVYNYLSTEGFLVLMLIRFNTQDWACRRIVRLLWENSEPLIVKHEPSLEDKQGLNHSSTPLSPSDPGLADTSSGSTPRKLPMSPNKTENMKLNFNDMV